MIIWKGKELTSIHDQKDINVVWFLALKIWSIVSSSCFGSGRWINDLPWSDTDAWKNE